MLKVKGIFERKLAKFNLEDCIIEGIEFMDNEEFEEFSKNLLEDRDFIRDRKEEMYIDEGGAVHSLLALNMGSGDGILIDSQGFDYARYTNYLPNIKPYIDNHRAMVVDKIIEEATNNSSNGSRVVYFDEIEERIRILKIEPQKLPSEKEINNDLKGIQDEVEGLFECIYLDENCILVCNEEGKINGMELNRRVGNDIIAGPFFIVGDSRNGEFISLTDGQVEEYKKEFSEIQEFTGDEPEAQPWMEFREFEF